MSALISPRSFRSLAAGAALASCSLAAASLPPSSKTTIDVASCQGSLGSFTASGTFFGPSNVVSFALFPSGFGSGHINCGEYYAGPGSTVDAFFATLTNLASPDTTATFSLDFILVLSETAAFSDLSIGTAALPMAWTANFNPISNGDLLAAGSYWFSGTGSWSDSSDPKNSIMFGMGLAYGSAVPLPGAVGLAAVGLVGLGGRRRR